MGTWAAAMTGKSTGAIATIQVLGDRAGQIVARIFRPVPPSPGAWTPGRIALGTVVDGQEVLDQVVLGCEGRDLFALHCHGNPLIVEAVMALVARNGAEPVQPEALLARVLRSRGATTLEVEARLAQLRARTLEGVRLIANQVCGGLVPMVRGWLERPAHEVRDQARAVLARSAPARLIVEGCTVAIVGPPNTGKSTLLNAMAGQDKAVVADIRGTTRDSVRAEWRVGPLCLDLIDTAGLTADPACDVDRAAQGQALQAMDTADLVLLVLDGSQPADQVSGLPLDRIAARPVLTVLNKSDLAHRLAPADLTAPLGTACLRLSARYRPDLAALGQAIREACGVAGLSLDTLVAFTSRQRLLLEDLAHAGRPPDPQAAVRQLLHGPLEGDGPLRGAAGAPA